LNITRVNAGLPNVTISDSVINELPLQLQNNKAFVFLSYPLDNKYYRASLYFYLTDSNSQHLANLRSANSSSSVSHTTKLAPSSDSNTIPEDELHPMQSFDAVILIVHEEVSILLTVIVNIALTPLLLLSRQCCRH
jgi:hypothetical protein